MFIKIMIDEIVCGTPTETGLNDRDEVYFVLAGASPQGPIQINRVSPPAPEDYYGLHAGERARNIQLWEGWLGIGQSAFLTVLVREQDNAQLAAIAAAARTVALGVASIFVPTLVPTALSSLKDTAISLINSFEGDADNTIGIFSVLITNQGEDFTVVWDNIADTNIVSPLPYTGSSKLFDATGDGSHYTVQASIQKSQLPMIVNRNSGKCLDVAGGVLDDHAAIQQFTMHGGDNQRWLLKSLGFSFAFPVNTLLFPHSAILAAHSGKCLDVENGSMDDQAMVQQYLPHYGENQSWIFAQIISSGDYALINLHSRKVLDVAGGSMDDGARVQQFTYHGGPGQRWYLQY
jgi:hypothetical protein